MKKNRIPTDGHPTTWSRPFAVLKDLNLPAISEDKSPKNRGRVDIQRQTAHRGGKTVIVVTNFTGVSQTEKEQLAKSMQKACGAGGTVKEGRVEIQGDHRDKVAEILKGAGFRPVFTGG